MSAALRTLILPLLVMLGLGQALFSAATHCAVPSGVGVGWGFVSAVVLFVIVVLAWYAADHALRHNGLRWALAGAALLFAVLTMFDAYVLARGRIHLHQGAALLFVTGSPSEVLREMGLHPLVLWALVGGLLFVAATGAWLRSRFPMPPLRPRGRRVIWALLLILSLGFVGEQYVAHATISYRFRAYYLPAYPTLFGSGLEHTVQLPAATSEADRRTEIAGLGRAQNPRHVVFIVLESFRRDAIDPQITPNLHHLAAESVRCDGARTSAIATLAAWNALLMNRPAATVSEDGARGESRDGGAVPLNLLRAAGYRLHLAFSTGLDYGNYRERLLGRVGIAHETFLPYDDHADETRAWRDARVAEKAVAWIEGLAQKPTALLLQFDATHWRYTFDESRALVSDYERDPGAGSLSSERVSALHRRYLNAAHDVDRNVGQVLDALRRRGLYNETAIVVVGDHGEGFREGYMSHVTFDRPVVEIPLLFHLPGVPPGRIPTLVATEDAMATLLDYLRIEGLAPWMLWGHSILRPATLPGVTITADGHQSRFLLTLPGGTVDLAAEKRPHGLIHFVIRNATGTDGKPVADLEDFVRQLDWKAALARLLTRKRSPL